MPLFFTGDLPYTSNVVSRLVYKDRSESPFSFGHLYAHLIDLDVFLAISNYHHKLDQSEFDKLLRICTETRENGLKQTELMQMNRSTFVMNNLTSDQVRDLDANYPDIDGVNSLLTTCIDAGITLNLRRDSRSNGIICYANQGDFAVSGRSPMASDALVIALWKCHLLKYRLSEGFSSNSPSARG